jgi:predicted lipoprotein
MDAWQHAEMLQIGPAGSSSKIIAGDNIRDEIYSWPTVNSCRVDQELVEEVYSASSFFGDELVNVYGLDAIEYLVFEQSAENTCPSVVYLNTSGSWNALSDGDLKSGRASYSKALAANLVARANDLVSYWSADDGNFIEDLAKAGESGSVYETQLDALNDIFAAMFYLDTTIKDKKISDTGGS